MDRRDVPEHFRTHKFLKAYSTLRERFANEERFDVKTAVGILGEHEDTVRDYLNYMSDFGNSKKFHLKVQSRAPRKKYYFGCTPKENLKASARQTETAHAEQAFYVMDRVAGLFRPLRIATSDLPWNEKAELVQDWYRKDGYWREVHALFGAMPLLVVAGICIANAVQVPSSEDSR